MSDIDKSKQLVECKIVLYNLLLIEDMKKEWKNVPGGIMLREILSSSICDNLIPLKVSHELKFMRESIIRSIGQERVNRILDYKESKNDSSLAKNEIFWYPKRNIVLKGLKMSPLERLNHWCKR